MAQDQVSDSFLFDVNNVKEGKIENIKKVKSWGRVDFYGGGWGGGGHSKKWLL